MFLTNYTSTFAGQRANVRLFRADAQGRAFPLWTRCLQLDAYRALEIDPANLIPSSGSIGNGLRAESVAVDADRVYAAGRQPAGVGGSFTIGSVVGAWSVAAGEFQWAADPIDTRFVKHLKVVGDLLIGLALGTLSDTEAGVTFYAWDKATGALAWTSDLVTGVGTVEMFAASGGLLFMSGFTKFVILDAETGNVTFEKSDPQPIRGRWLHVDSDGDIHYAAGDFPPTESQRFGDLHGTAYGPTGPATGCINTEGVGVPSKVSTVRFLDELFQPLELLGVSPTRLFMRSRSPGTETVVTDRAGNVVYCTHGPIALKGGAVDSFGNAWTCGRSDPSGSPDLAQNDLRPTIFGLRSFQPGDRYVWLTPVWSLAGGAHSGSGSQETFRAATAGDLLAVAGAGAIIAAPLGHVVGTAPPADCDSGYYYYGGGGGPGPGVNGVTDTFTGSAGQSLFSHTTDTGQHWLDAGDTPFFQGLNGDGTSFGVIPNENEFVALLDADVTGAERLSIEIPSVDPACVPGVVFRANPPGSGGSLPAQAWKAVTERTALVPSTQWRVRLYQRVSGSWELRAESDPQGFAHGQLTVHDDGEWIGVDAGGVRLITHQSTDYAANKRQGITASGSNQADFDNFTIRTRAGCSGSGDYQWDDTAGEWTPLSGEDCTCSLLPPIRPGDFDEEIEAGRCGHWT